jgi:hypothetical protein
MSLKTAKGRLNPIESSYYRIFAENADDSLAVALSDLMSKIHSVSISSGNRLDSIYIPSPEFNRNKVITKQKSSKVDWDNCIGHYSKFQVSKADCPNITNKSHSEIDYLTITDTEVHLFEVKDGDNFDTKKSQGEKHSLEVLKQFFQAKFPEKKIHIRLVFWNSNDVTKHGLKTADIDPEMIITGKTFCEIIDCDYDGINKSRREYAKENKECVWEKFEQIVKLRNNTNSS